MGGASKWQDPFYIRISLDRACGPVDHVIFWKPKSPGAPCRLLYGALRGWTRVMHLHSTRIDGTLHQEQKYCCHLQYSQSATNAQHCRIASKPRPKLRSNAHNPALPFYQIELALIIRTSLRQRRPSIRRRTPSPRASCRLLGAQPRHRTPEVVVRVGIGVSVAVVLSVARFPVVVIVATISSLVSALSHASR
jgi:hypothetical protein